MAKSSAIGVDGDDLASDLAIPAIGIIALMLKQGRIQHGFPRSALSIAYQDAAVGAGILCLNMPSSHRLEFKARFTSHDQSSGKHPSILM